MSVSFTHMCVLHIPGVVREKCPREFFRVLQETCRHKNRTKHRQSERTQREYSIFFGIWSYSWINRSGVNFVSSFILSSLKFLTICANLPFCLCCRRHLQSVPWPWFGWVFKRIKPRCPLTAYEANLTTMTTLTLPTSLTNHRTSTVAIVSQLPSPLTNTLFRRER